MDLYSSLTILCLLTMGVLATLVTQNNRLDKTQKKRFLVTYLVIALSALCEWAGVILNGAPAGTRTLHSFVKYLDYALTPITGVLFAHQVLGDDTRVYRSVRFVMFCNCVYQLIATFFEWTFYLDENNYYHHGPLYIVYTCIYLIAILFTIYEFAKYGRLYRRHNRSSLFMIILLTLVGIGLQEVLGSGVRTVNITLAISSAMLFIHYNEFAQIKQDDDLEKQIVRTNTDSMTGLKNRYSYSEALVELKNLDELPDDLAIFAMDINGLKPANDTRGHQAGDELICGAADVIRTTLGSLGDCYRTGGDEFVAILRLGSKSPANLFEQLTRNANAWHGKLVDTLSLSIGYVQAWESKDASVEQLANTADMRMYQAKSDYYKDKVRAR